MSGIKNVVTGFLGAILVALSLQVITPPNYVLTSKVDPNSLTGRIVWNTRFEIVAIGLGFLIGFILGSLEPRKTPKTVDILGREHHRQCPHCMEQMHRDASVCPHCRRESQAWTLDNGVWWLEIDGGWCWLDELSNDWVKWESAPLSTS